MSIFARWSRKLALASIALTAAPPAQSMWVTAYYAGWRQRHLAPADIDFDAVTHLVHFAVYPRADGTLDAETNLLGRANVDAAVSAAHAAGKKILYTVGGQSSRTRFLGAMSDSRRAAFIRNLVAFMTDNGYDGIDVDMEEILPADGPSFDRFIRNLRTSLNEVSPRPLLTAAVNWEPGVFAKLADQFDQINIMTYDLAGAYPGWVTWHSGAVYDGGYRFANGVPLPAADRQVDAFLAAGVPKSKLGIGLSFYGYIWSGGGVSRPRQSWTTPPAVTDIPYYVLADTYGVEGFQWDAKAQAAYLSIEDQGPGERKFISYDNEVTALKKVQYVKDKGLGGMIIWELGGGYRASQPEGRRDLLLQAVKRAAFGPAVAR